MAEAMYLTITSLPAEDNFEIGKEVNFSVISSNKGRHCDFLIEENTRGASR